MNAIDSAVLAYIQEHGSISSEVYGQITSLFIKESETDDLFKDMVSKYDEYIKSIEALGESPTENISSFKSASSAFSSSIEKFYDAWKKEINSITESAAIVLTNKAASVAMKMITNKLNKLVGDINSGKALVTDLAAEKFIYSRTQIRSGIPRLMASETKILFKKFKQDSDDGSRANKKSQRDKAYRDICNQLKENLKTAEKLRAFDETIGKLIASHDKNS